MSISRALLSEFDHEMSLSRKTMERVPADNLNYKPHEKSMTMGRLLSHLAEVVGWMVTIIDEDSFDLHPPGGEPYQPVEYTSVEAALAAFDKHVAEAHKALAGTSDETLMKMWSLKRQDQKIVEMPKVACIRSFTMNHSIHHRAQLGVYLRLNDRPLPAIYGPSADEGQM